MTEVFFSYSSKDRQRVQAIRDALVERGFAIFWDQQVPAGTDWDTWIRQHLSGSLCVVVIWSVNSIVSDNVRHEASIAKRQNKIVPVLLDEIGTEQFPMGLYAVQAANLSSWTGDVSHPEWLKLLDQVESKLTPLWIKRTLDALEAELVSERARREAAERRDRTFRDQIAKEANARQQLTADLNLAREQVAELEMAVESREQQRASAENRVIELTEALTVARNQADLETRNRVETLMRRISELEGALAHRPTLEPQLLEQAAPSANVNSEATANLAPPPVSEVIAQGRTGDAFATLAKRGLLVFVAIAAVLALAVNTMAALAPPSIELVYDPATEVLKWTAQQADAVYIYPGLGQKETEGQLRVPKGKTQATYTATATAKRLIVWTVTSPPVEFLVPAAAPQPGTPAPASTQPVASTAPPATTQPPPNIAKPTAKPAAPASKGKTGGTNAGSKPPI